VAGFPRKASRLRVGGPSGEGVTAAGAVAAQLSASNRKSGTEKREVAAASGNDEYDRGGSGGADSVSARVTFLYSLLPHDNEPWVCIKLANNLN